MGGSILGNRVLRKEDPKFLTTGGVYVDDLLDEPLLHNAVHVTYARSSVAHGHILSIDTSEAAAMPGVIAVFTGADLGLQPVPSAFNPAATRTLLATDKVRYVGEPLAIIVSETREQGEDASEAIIVDYDVLEALVDVEKAMASSLHLYEACGSNVVFDTTALGIPENSGEAFFAGCEVVVTGRYINQRVAPCPLEVRGAAAAWGPDGRLTQWLSTQHAQGAPAPIAAANGVDVSQVRVKTPDVGGGFGAKIGTYPEDLLLGVVAKRVGRPVRWRETRSESMVGLGHGRAQLQFITIGGSRNGKVSHYQMHAIQDSGAWVDMGTILAPFMTRPMSSGVYAIPNIECRTTSVVTNTTPTVAYRGAGRPEATAAIERTIDEFARVCGIDPAEVRRRNYIAPSDFPLTTPMGAKYDSGEYAAALELALKAAGYDQLLVEQKKRRDSKDPVQIGIGIASYVETTNPMGSGDYGSVEIKADGGAIVRTGSSSHGQGHHTAWAMIVSQTTGIPMDKIEFRFGDTDDVDRGGGTGGSRSLQVGGSAAKLAAESVIEKARQRAADLLEAAVEDIIIDTVRGAFHVKGSPTPARTWAELMIEIDAPLEAEVDYVPEGATFPFGTHVCVVEVDVETGSVVVARHIACDDAGTIINPLLVDGQVHGGIAQGVAQALLEVIAYDPDGNPITSNLADYGFISAAELPSFERVPMETPTPRNPLGAKGIGEAGTIGATPAVHNAVVNAVSHLGVTHIDMPCTSFNVWTAIQAVR